MKKLLFISAVLIFMSQKASSQSWRFLRSEVVGMIGTSNFFGELGGANDIGSSGIQGFKDLDIQMTRPCVAVGYRYYISPKFALRSDFTYARLNGDDALTEERFRNNRNLHFRSPAIELSGRVEFYPFAEYFGHLYRMKGIKGSGLHKWSPYVFVGVGGFWFNPKAKYNGDWIALRPLQTEDIAYSPIAISLPFGGGLKYGVSKSLSIGIEFALRYTNTDYIDDVSSVYVDQSSESDMVQYLSNPTTGEIENYVDGTYTYDPTAPGIERGDIENNDAFALMMISVNYKFLKGRKNLPKF